MSKIILSQTFIKDRVKLALAEDLYPLGDITSNLLKNNKIIEAKIISNQKAVVAGLLFAKQSFKQVDKKNKFILKKKDGSIVKKNSVLIFVLKLWLKKCGNPRLSKKKILYCGSMNNLYQKNIM